MLSLDGRSFGVETGFKVGQVIQLEGEAHTREILRIDSLTKDAAADYGVSNPFETWGFESVLVLGDLNDVVVFPALAGVLESAGADVVVHSQGRS